MTSIRRSSIKPTFRKVAQTIAAGSVFAASFSIHAHAQVQDTLTSFIRGSTTAKPYFAVFDVRPGTVSQATIQETVAAAFRIHYNAIVVNQQIPSYPLPVNAPRMGFVQRQTSIGPVSTPICNGASSVISSSDSSMMKYGEVTILQACVFPYKDGTRVNVYAFFGQKSGASSVATIGASIGRVFTNAVGLGDSSKFIDETIEDINKRLAAISSEVRLVELTPERADHPLATDLATPMTAMDVQAQSAPALTSMVPASMQAQLAAVSAALGSARAAAGAPQPGSSGGVIQARKDLSAMGLSYFSQEQFVDAVKRGDDVACGLFMQAGGVDPGRADKNGMTPLQYAKTPAVIAVLQQAPRQ